MSRLTFAVGALAILVGTLRSADLSPLAVGGTVPITSMRAVLDRRGDSDAHPIDRNTCFAGKYRDKRAVSVYVQNLDESGMDAFLQKLDASLASNKEVRGYVLLMNGSQFDGELKAKIREWFEKHKISKLDVAIANGDPTGGLVKDRAVAVAFSERRHVKYLRLADTGSLKPATITDIIGSLEEMAK
jgi:hypothetical protein